jgi:hypothetical protein
MDATANGLVTVLNGLLTMLDGLLTPVALMAVVIAFSLTWIALVELDELDRRGTKPEIGRGL